MRARQASTFSRCLGVPRQASRREPIMRSVSAALSRVLLAFFGLLIILRVRLAHVQPRRRPTICPSFPYLAATQDQIGAIFASRPLARAVRRSGVRSRLRCRFCSCSSCSAQACEFSLSSAAPMVLCWPPSPPMSCRRSPRARSGPLPRSKRCTVFRHQFLEQALGSDGHKRRRTTESRDRDRTRKLLNGRRYVSRSASQRLMSSYAWRAR